MLTPLPVAAQRPVRVELTLRRCWLSEVILQGAGIKCQVLIGTCSVPRPELKEVLALAAGRLRSSGNVKVQLGCQVLSLQQDGFEHNQTPGSLCRIKAEPLLCGPAETWQGSQPSYHKLRSQTCLEAALPARRSEVVFLPLQRSGGHSTRCGVWLAAGRTRGCRGGGRGRGRKRAARAEWKSWAEVWRCVIFGVSECQPVR